MKTRPLTGQENRTYADKTFMKTSLAKYTVRSPRYILSTEDDYLIRVAGPQQTPWEEGTEIRDISLTGLCFTAPDDLCPQMGEFIKIQFTPPGSPQMACHAIVTRINDERRHKKLVGVHFYKLDMGHRIALAQGLQKKFKKSGQSHRDEFLTPGIEPWGPAQVPTFISMFVCYFLWVYITAQIMSWPIEQFYNEWMELLKGFGV